MLIREQHQKRGPIAEVKLECILTFVKEDILHFVKEDIFVVSQARKEGRIGLNRQARPRVREKQRAQQCSGNGPPTNEATPLSGRSGAGAVTRVGKALG